MEQSSNQLLASLPPNVFASLVPHLRTVKLTLGDIAAEAGGEVKHAYFPHSGVISLVVELDVGQMIETAMVGCDGVLNASSALDGKISMNKGIVQLSGEASVIDVDHLRKIAKDYESFRSLLIRHDQVLFAQAQQSAACNASHSVESRMCRWLLRMRDLAVSDDLTLTQEFLAQMLGVRRPSVSIVAGTLQKAGLIRYRRGHIRILDQQGLKDGSCECYQTVKSYYDRLKNID
jgi:CRP-like cAMP-binding protein